MSTYTPIASQTLSSTAASVTFSSIPQGYTDLVMICTTKGSVLGSMRMQFNADTGSNYSSTQLSADTGAGTAVSARFSNVSDIRIGYYQTGMSTTDYLPCIIQLQNYSNSTTYKTALGRSAKQSVATVGLWRNTNAVSTITLFEDGGNIQSGSTFSLYGIQVGQAAQKAQGGNIVTSDGTYVYHTFTSSGAFIPSQALTVDYLVVAGGGGGGYGLGQGGGGGAGGVRCTVGATGGGGSLESALSLTAKSYPVIVGAGGAGGTSNNNAATTSGSNSVFGSITSTGGGGGGNWISAGATGGSGGGGSAGGTNAGGSGTANQGYAGGSGNGSGQGGGGGGAAAVGGSPASGSFTTKAGNGGNGIATAISGTSTYYGGGGGGSGYVGSGNYGDGGLGGGGRGNAGDPPSGQDNTAGTANTGGGGGAGAVGNGKAGGSGIVIIRYLA